MVILNHTFQGRPKSVEAKAGSDGISIMSLILVFHNDGTGIEEASNYDVEVLIGDGTRAGSRSLWKARVEGHDRSQPWWELVLAFLKKMPSTRKRLRNV